MLPNSTDLKYFLEAYKVGNISRASERLGITQPSLSLAIKRLEELLNSKLFIRSKGGVLATEQGHLLAKDTEALLIQWESIGNKTKNSQNLVQGNIKLGCHASVALYSLNPWFKKLLKEHPELSIDFSHKLSRKVAEEVISFKTDIGIVVNPIKHPDLVIKHLFDDEVTLWRSKLQNINEDTLIYDPDLNQAQSLLKNLKVDFKRQVKSSNLEVISQLTKIGSGVGILPGRVAGPDLVPYNSSIKSFKDRVCLIYRGDKPKTKTLMTVVEALLGNLK